MGEKGDVFHYNMMLVGRNDTFLEWSCIALRNHWLMTKQEELVSELEEQDRLESLKEEGIHKD